MKELYEDKLVSELKQGSQTAFRNLVERFQKKVFNVSLSFVRNIEEAEDVSQEVFIEAFRAMTHFREESSLGTWIYRITVNKSLESIRRRKVKKRFAVIASLFGADENRSALEIPDFRHPGLALEDQEKGEILFAAIDRLSEHQKIAFVLHHVEGLSYQEIADVQQTTVSSVESLIFRAKQNLRKRLSSYYKNI